MFKVDIVLFPRTFGLHCTRHRAHAVGRKIIQEWISLRPELASKLHPMVAKPFMWYDSTNGGVPLPDIHDTGDWVYFALKREKCRCILRARRRCWGGGHSLVANSSLRQCIAVACTL